MNTELDLQDKFLIAMPGLVDFNFNQAVVYVCAHSEDGSMGVVINRPVVDINLGEILAQMHIEGASEGINELPVYLGGPVQPERGFIVHHPNSEWQSTLITSDELGVTSSQDILQAIALGEGPEDAIVTLGYSGWGEGQLVEEISKNLWLTVPADPRILFDTPYHLRWQEAAAIIGVDIANLSTQAGHG